MININASIIDQQVTGLLERHCDWFPANDDHSKRSQAFVLLCVATYLDIPQEEALECLTDGGNDAGVDALALGDIEDNEFQVTLFQGKYKLKNLDRSAHFPANAVGKAIATVQVLFDPDRRSTLNEKLAPKVAEIRSLIRDGYIPRVRFVLCNNGAKWNHIAQEKIADLEQKLLNKVEFCHFNHDSIVTILQRVKEVDAKIQFSGKLITEDMKYMRVLLGRVAVQQIADLFEQHGNRLLQRNIRRYLGLHSNRVNSAIHDTLCSEKADNFYFYNNGITVVCEKFDYNALQEKDHSVDIKNMQIINGGQTCKTIHETLKSVAVEKYPQSAYVMVRVYQLAEERKDFVQEITYATNSQNPVDLRDLRSNDKMQQDLELGMKGLGYTYKRQREEGGGGSTVITSSIAAEATLAVWREKPHQAKFRRKEHFGKLYEDIFTALDPAQAILAVLIFREVENERKRPSTENPPSFMPYASHYIAMLVGRALLDDQKIELTDMTPHNFKALEHNLRNHKLNYYAEAVQKLSQALKDLYGDRDISLQQLAATFRRGDLLEELSGTSLSQSGLLFL